MSRTAFSPFLTSRSAQNSSSASNLQTLLALETTGLATPTISCSISNWVMRLLPSHLKCAELTRFLGGAAMAGCEWERYKDCTVGQVSFLTCKASVIVFKPLYIWQRERLFKLAQYLCLSKPASILRTAIMLGLPLPRIELGVISCTRTEPLTELEIAKIMTWERG